MTNRGNCYSCDVPYAKYNFACTKCGNSIFISGDGEQCDDGNDSNGDGCSSSCQIETGYSCDTQSNPLSSCDLCGNNKRGGTEGCDDGTDDDEGCAPGCQMPGNMDGWACSGGSPSSND